MGFMQKWAERSLWKVAETGRMPLGSTGRLLWSLSGRTPDSMWREMTLRRGVPSMEREFRSSLENPQTPLSFPAEWLLDIFNGGRTDSGIRVSEMTALQTDAVLSCVSIVSNGIGSLPLHVYEGQQLNGRTAKKRATDHPLYDLLMTQPNEEMTSATFRAVMEVHGLLWGNAYGEIQRDNAARPVAIWPRNPARTRPVRLTHDARIEGTTYPRGYLVYRTSESFGAEISHEDDNSNRSAPERLILPEDMLHIPGLSLDGRLGQSTVYLSRQIIGLALAAEKHGAKLFGNGAVPRGVLEIPSALEPRAIENLRRSWQEAHGGENQHRTAVLEAGVKYSPIGIDPEKAQLLDSRKYQRRVIASIFQVPPHMIGEGESSKSTTEQSAIEFLNLCLNPRLNKWEQELKRKLFRADDPAAAGFFAKFDTHRLLYGTAEARSKYYQVGKAGGYLNTNDIREMEDLNPVEDGSGEVYWAPVNVVDASTGLLVGQKPGEAQPINPEKPGGGTPQNPKGKGPVVDKQPLSGPASPGVKGAITASLVGRYARVFQPMLADAAGRLLNRKSPDKRVFERAVRPVLVAMADAMSLEVAPLRSTVEKGTDNVERTVTEERHVAADLGPQLDAYLEGMFSNFRGVMKPGDFDWSTREARRAAETLGGLVGRRYDPDQLRHPDGKWHDGKKPFFVGRHGTTDDDVNGVWSGKNGVRLNDQGRLEVGDTAERLKAVGIKRIVSSPEPRALETAQAYATALGVPMTTDWRLGPLDLGVFSGLNEKDNAGKLEVYLKNPDVPIPGGVAVNDYLRDTQASMDDYRGENEGTGPILVLSHSSTIASYVSRVKTGRPDDLEHASSMLTPAGVLRFDGKKVTAIVGELKKGDAA